MKREYWSAKAKPTLLNLLFWLVILILYACGAGSSGGDDSPETGSVTFGLALDESGAIRALSTRQLDDENGQFECQTEEYEIDKIEAQVLDENDDILAEGGPFNCEDREGSVDGIEAGDDRILKVFAKNPDGIVIFGGKSGFFTVIGGQTTEVETITLNREEVPPEAKNDTATTDEDVPKIIDVLANDGDANGDSLTISEVTQGSSGTVTIASDGKSLTYSPNKDYLTHQNI